MDLSAPRVHHSSTINQELSLKMQRQRFSQSGFSAIELLVVVSVLVILSTFAVFSWRGTNQNFLATAGMDDVVGQLRTARQLAISERRSIEVAFNGANQIQLTPETTTGAPVVPNPFLPDTLSSGVQFLLFPGVPDTPMAFGNNAAVTLVAAGAPPVAPVHFVSNGSLTDNNNNFVNGTIFLGLPGFKGTARAVTILGATGRVRPYYWDGAKWNE
jgi:prepilin-type N-terminal cleavage/methylation domain-containing protein